MRRRTRFGNGTSAAPLSVSRVFRLLQAAKNVVPLAATLPVLLGGIDTAHARTWYVTPDGTGDAPTIQAAVNSTSPGDVVELADGIFTGDGNRDIWIENRSVIIRSEGGDPDACVLDIQGSESEQHNGFTFYGYRGETGGGVEGVTIRNGYSYSGAAIICGSSSTVLSNLIIEDNMTGRRGGGIALFGGTCEVADCLFRNNTAGKGGAIFCKDVELYLAGSSFIGNQASDFGGAIALGSFPWAKGEGEESGEAYNWVTEITNCTFIRNCAEIGGTMNAWSGTHLIRNCTIFASCGPTGAFQAGCGEGYCGKFHIGNCIVAYTQAGDAGDPFGTVYCSVIYGNAEGPGSFGGHIGQNNNIAVDPLFCDQDSDVLTLRSDSPCAEGNHPEGAACGLIGAQDISCTPGTQERRTSWGALKSLFR